MIFWIFYLSPKARLGITGTAKCSLLFALQNHGKHETCKSNRRIAQTKKNQPIRRISFSGHQISSQVKRVYKMFVRQGNDVYAGMRLMRSITLILCHVTYTTAQSYCIIKRSTAS
jgi:hypothetical protein